MIYFLWSLRYGKPARESVERGRSGMDDLSPPPTYNFDETPV